MQLNAPSGSPIVARERKQVNAEAQQTQFTTTNIEFLGAFAKLPKATALSCPSIRPPAWNNSALTERIFVSLSIFQKSIEKIKLSLQPDKNNVYFCMMTYVRL
jgi:hypothetical protein